MRQWLDRHYEGMCDACLMVCVLTGGWFVTDLLLRAILSLPRGDIISKTIGVLG